MPPRITPPLLLRSPLSGRIFIATRYTSKNKAGISALVDDTTDEQPALAAVTNASADPMDDIESIVVHEKFDVTEQFGRVTSEIAEATNRITGLE